MTDIVDFFARLPMQGPGSDAETSRILDAIIGRLPARPLVADLGCGTGRTALLLAKRLDGRVAAVDQAEPFLAQLREDAEAAGLGDRVEARAADMLTPGIAAASLDLLWSEGAVYAAGFERALQAWLPLAKPGGLAVVSECTWLVPEEERPAAARDFWRETYPAMGSVEDNVQAARRAGWEVVAISPLSDDAWRSYYRMIHDEIARRGDELASDLVAAFQAESRLFEAAGTSYGYVFYCLQRPAAHRRSSSAGSGLYRRAIRSI